MTAALLYAPPEYPDYKDFSDVKNGKDDFVHLFVIIIRGPIAGALSLSGGMLSVAVIIALVFVLKPSYATLGISGAVSHNIGQFAMAALILAMPMPYGLYYMPLLLVLGVATGTLTSIILKHCNTNVI